MATHKPINILEAFAAAPPPLDYVLPNMVAGTVGALVSPGGAGKSMLALQLAAQIAGGPDLLEVGELPTGPVIYLPAEDPPTAIHHRLHALGAHLSAEERQAVADGLLIQPLIGSLPNIMAPEWFDGLKRAAEGRRLMVLDTLRRFHIEEENASGPMAQVIGRTVWRALERYLFKDAGKPRFKSKSRGLNSIEGTDNREIMYKPECQAVVWRKQVLRLVNADTPYRKEALADPLDKSRSKRVKYCRIVRRTINGTKRWFAQICLEGQPPVRKIYALQSEVVGIDPGPSQIAYFHEHYADIVKVSPNVDLQEKAVRRLQRKIDRSRRANNPDNYEDDGRIKRGPLKWKFSHRFNKLSRELAEHHRCLAATRKRDHGALANLLLQIGGTIKIEKNSYRSYQRNFGKSTTRSTWKQFLVMISVVQSSQQFVCGHGN